MQYPVPQFIDVEDKIIGPFSLKQFGFIFVGGLIIVGIFRVMGGISAIFIFISLPIALVSLVLAFGKFNGRMIYESFPIFLGFASSDKNLVFQKKGDIGDLRIQPITVDQIKAQVATNAGPTEADLEGPQSKLKRLGRLLQQKNEEQQEIINQNRTTPAPKRNDLEERFKV